MTNDEQMAKLMEEFQSFASNPQMNGMLDNMAAQLVWMRTDSALVFFFLMLTFSLLVAMFDDCLIVI